MEEKFTNILNDNEKVIAVTNATKSYALKKSITTFIIGLFFLALFGTLSIALPWREIENPTYFHPEGSMVGFPWIVAVIVPGVFFIVTLTIYIVAKFGENNYFVCLTDKRILIRYGCFTNSYHQYSIENVSGNIEINCNQSIFDRRNEKACNIRLAIELLPVGHGKLTVWTAAVNNGYELAKQIEKVVKDNAKQNKPKTIKE